MAAWTPATWDAYFEALTESLSTEYYADAYPEYAAVCDAVNHADVLLIRGLLDAGHDAQEGLDKLVDSLIRGSRYAKDFLDALGVEVFEMFHRSGARVPYKKLFASAKVADDDRIAYILKWVRDFCANEHGYKVVNVSARARVCACMRARSRVRG